MMDLNLYESIMKQAHTLIAGCTGSGKSVALNALIYTIIQHSPAFHKLILCDPKRVEFRPYKNLPHVLAYGNDTESIIECLRYAVELMEERYLEIENSADIWQKETTAPHVYIIIDELADLMQTGGKEAAGLLQRLAQKARATHIHIIAATQHPSRKTLPAFIQDNFTARVALRCESAIESRQIMKQAGAEKLPRFGYCYYMIPDYTAPRRTKINMVETADLQEAVNRWKPATPAPASVASSVDAPAPTVRRVPVAEPPRRRSFLEKVLYILGKED